MIQLYIHRVHTTIKMTIQVQVLHDDKDASVKPVVYDDDDDDDDDDQRTYLKNKIFFSIKFISRH